MTPQKCPTCGAPAGPSAPDGDFRYRPAHAENLRAGVDAVIALLREPDDDTLNRVMVACRAADSREGARQALADIADLLEARRG